MKHPSGGSHGIDAAAVGNRGQKRREVPHGEAVLGLLQGRRGAE